ncbi:MAG: uracil-DNA glycosylase family protein, partial [Candidatus Thorarchaeota archaeon]
MMSALIPNLAKLEDIAADHAPQDICPGCPFGGPRVGSKGHHLAPIVFVAESPGIEEVKGGAPLIGPSGKLFHQYVPDDESVYILNALECRPTQGLKTEPRMNDATINCRERLLTQITSSPRRIIIAMGNAAVRSLVGDMHLKITQIRGRLIPSPLAELGIFPMVHIAALMRGTGSWRQWKQDIQYAMELGNGASPTEHIPAEVEIIPYDFTPEDCAQLFAQMGSNLTADIETTGLDHVTDRILSIGITPENDPGISYCFYPHHFPILRPYLESRDISWCWHNGKFDIKFLWGAGIRARVDDDTMLLSYAQDELGGVHGLETVAADVLDAPDYKHMIQQYLPNRKSSYELIPADVLAAYQAIDTSNTAQIRRIYRERVRQDEAAEKL